MNNSRQNFRIFLLAGLATTCLMGGLATWISIGESMQRLQRDSLKARMHEVSSVIESRIGDFVNGLEYLSRRPRLISAVMGDVTQIDNVVDVVRSFDLYDDLVAISLVDVLGDTILAETLPNIVRPGMDLDVSPEQFRELVDQVLANDGDGTVRIQYLGSRGVDHFVAAVPVLRNGGTEGVLLGTFRLDLASFRRMDSQLVALTVDEPREPGHTVGEGYISSSMSMADGQLSMHLLWSKDRFKEERRRLVLVVMASLLAGLLLAFGGLAWVGQRIILGPQHELERSRMALARSEAKARELAVVAESSLDTITVNDPNGTVQWANPAFEQKWGYSVEEVLGRDGLKLRTGPRTKVAEVMDAFRATGAYIGENTYYTRDGTPVEVIVSVQALPTVDDSPPKFVVMCRDITELKRRETELVDARAKADLAGSEATKVRLQLEEAIEALDDAFVFYDAEDRMITFNKAYRDLLGPAGKFAEKGKTFLEMAQAFAEAGIVPEAVGNEREYVEKLIAERESINGVDRVFKSSNGRWLRHRDTRTKSGAVVGLRVDVTELKEREAELERERERAEAANHAKSNFLANMSHEIRTPMNGIMGMCELLNETDLNDEQRLCAKTINNSAEALLSIINNILDFSKIEAGKQEILEEPFSLQNVVFDVARLLNMTAHEKTIEICVDFDDTLSDHWLGDIGRIRQVLINLTGNAIKFTEEGYVLIAVAPSSQAGGGISFKVADTGIGIPAHKLDRIFQAFEQVDNESTRRHDGTGLGLAITDGLVQAMGGKIQVQSREGLGSRFMFDLPLAPAEAAEPEISEDGKDLEEVCARALAGKTVLIVDDLEVNRYILCKRLSRLGARPISIASGEEALDLVMENTHADATRIDLAVLDHQMPDIDGEKLLVALSGRTGAPPFPTILYSSMDFSVDSRRLHALGFSSIIVKPASPRALHRAILTALGFRPTRASDAAARSIDGPAPGDMSSQPLHVMAAEDNRTNQLVLKKMLKNFPVELEVFSNGQEILDAYVERGADLIFMDVSMPVMGGLEATQAIRAHEQSSGARRCPIVALTAKAMKHHQQECTDAGMDDFLTKPIKKAALGEALARHGTHQETGDDRKSA